MPRLLIFARPAVFLQAVRVHYGDRVAERNTGFFWLSNYLCGQEPNRLQLPFQHYFIYVTLRQPAFVVQVSPARSKTAILDPLFGLNVFIIVHLQRTKESAKGTETFPSSLQQWQVNHKYRLSVA
jgi:hypothetical protein